MDKDLTIDDLMENFSLFEDWEDKYRYLLELGEELDDMPLEDKTEANKVEGCTSQVWLTYELKKGDDGLGRLYFKADSDAHIVKGLIAILLTVYNGKMPQDILAIDIREIFKKLGLDENLSPTRRNGFFSMVKKIHETAAAVDW